MMEGLKLNHLEMFKNIYVIFTFSDPLVSLKYVSVNIFVYIFIICRFNPCPAEPRYTLLLQTV